MLNIDIKEYWINCSLNCDSSNIVCFLESNVVIYNVYVAAASILGFCLIIIRHVVVNLVWVISAQGDPRKENDVKLHRPLRLKFTKRELDGCLTDEQND